MYESWQLFSFPWVVGDAASWLYEGTGLQTGDLIQGVVGNEVDHRFANGYEPPGLTVLAHSPIIDNWGKPGWSDAMSYRASSGALVFASGSMYWSRGLDPLAVPDPRIGRMTANIFHEALGISVPPDLSAAGAPAQPLPAMGPVQTVVSTLVTGLSGPAGVAVIPQSASQFAGQVVVASTGTAQVLLVDPASGATRVLAGDGQASVSAAYDNVPGALARFELPVAVAADSAGRVYVADSGAAVIRRIDTDALHTTTTLAGMLGVAGNADGINSAARFARPAGVALQAGSSSLYVADNANHLIRAVNIETGAVTTVAGSVEGDGDGPALAARFDHPTGIAVAPDGRIFVLSSSSRKVKVILPDARRTVVTIAGGSEGFADGSGALARLSPQAGAAWVGTFLAVSDAAGLRVRGVVPGTNAVTTQAYTLAFSGGFGFSDGPAAAATVGLPTGLAVGADGSVYVADGANGAIRVIRRAQ
jgi:sugar lactone lactonase YvrE